MSEYLQVKHAVKPLLCIFQTCYYINVNVSNQCYILTGKGNVIISNQKSKFFILFKLRKRKRHPYFQIYGKINLTLKKYFLEKCILMLDNQIVH